MKLIHMEPGAEKAVARLMLRALGELHGRELSMATGLETLGIIAMRMLVGVQAIHFERIVEDAAQLVLEENLPVNAQSVKESLVGLFDTPEQLAKMGITVHSVH